MFTSNFTSRVITPASQGQPIVVAGPMHFFIHIFLLHPAILNSFAAITQVALGVLILWKRTTKIGLLGSMGWGLFVWWIGEGFGGLFGWHTLMLMGAPGAALIYVILAIAVFPKESKKNDNKENQNPAYWLAFVWALFWIIGAIYQLLPGQNSVSDVSSMVARNGLRQPGWLASLDSHVGSFINRLGAPTTSMANMHMTANQMARMQTQSGANYWFILLVASIQILIGLSVFATRYIRNTGIALGVIASLIFWVIGQSFGGIFTGLGTDPNSAILFIVLAIAILGCNNLSQKLSSFYGRIERAII
ncbi:MAG TPA: hypothetical protein VMR18_02090 [Candidatus Saccharimonadales bacterium]|nr:hypothetical protein [Candidatus Saccharimonadales bacterium]